MAINYTFVLDARLAPLELADWLAGAVGCDCSINEQGPVLEREGIICYVRSQSDLWKEIVFEHLDIESTAKIVCRLDKFEGLESGIVNVVRICLTILRDSTCDMALLEGERTLVVRKDGLIRIDCREPVWFDTWQDAFAKASLPFQKESLPSI